MMHIGILTSSRADFGIYLPLLKEMTKEPNIQFSIIAFGTHLSKFHGYTIKEIEDSGFEVAHAIPTLLSNESKEGIATSAALCSLKFASFWSQQYKDFNFVLCLGDRYEMFAAVSAGIPYGIKFAHLYGGDVSLGVIDDIYRNCLSHFSTIHFTSTNNCAKRVKALKGKEEYIEVVGILSLDDLKHLKLLSKEEIQKNWNINLSKPTILTTFHPETVNPQVNHAYSQVVFDTCNELVKDYQLVFTMPNADTEGYVYREKLLKLKKIFPERIFLVENFGRTAYFTCLQYCSMVLGNSSSGISESASFNKYAINVGSRQKGRETGENVYSVPFAKEAILEKINLIAKDPFFTGSNIYQQKNGAQKIIKAFQNITNSQIEKLQPNLK